MLHIVNKSPLLNSALASCLRLAQDGEAVILIEDGIFAATQGVAAGCGLADAVGRLEVYALAPDVDARGMTGRLTDGVKAVDYAGFVKLVVEHHTNQSWR